MAITRDDRIAILLIILSPLCVARTKGRAPLSIPFLLEAVKMFQDHWG
jgi:hypothetical protein